MLVLCRVVVYSISVNITATARKSKGSFVYRRDIIRFN